MNLLICVVAVGILTIVAVGYVGIVELRAIRELLEKKQD